MTMGRKTRVLGVSTPTYEAAWGRDGVGNDTGVEVGRIVGVGVLVGVAVNVGLGVGEGVGLGGGAAWRNVVAEN
jgi:hypothetical protein